LALQETIPDYFLLREVKVPPNSKVDGVLVADALVRWYRRDNLVRLLQLNLFTADDEEVDPQKARIYSLEKLDINRLLQVSPLTRPTSSTSELHTINGPHQD